MLDFVTPGRVLAGKYRIERLLGRGGMGLVAAATHLQLGQQVALKFLLPEVANHPEAHARFQREARAAARIQSEHVARVMDVGEEAGSPYLVMELLRGCDLSQLIERQGPLPCALAVDYLLQASEALAEAHSLGIVHRDLKTANLFLAERTDGSLLVKVLDFGISKAALDDGDSAMTATNTVLGSPKYMSPEQLRNAKDVDARADVWSLGVVLQELLTRMTPHTASTLVDLLTAIVSAAPTPLRAQRPDLPQALENVILRCLVKDRAGRFGNVWELAQALGPFASEEGRRSLARIERITLAGTGRSPSELTATPEPRSATATAWGAGRTAAQPAAREDKPRRRRALLLLAPLGAVGLTAALWLGVSTRAQPEAASDHAVTVVPAAAAAAPVSAAVASAAAAVPRVEPVAVAEAPPAASAAAASVPKPRPTKKHTAAPANGEIFTKRKW